MGGLFGPDWSAAGGWRLPATTLLALLAAAVPVAPAAAKPALALRYGCVSSDALRMVRTPAICRGRLVKFANGEAVHACRTANLVRVIAAGRSCARRGHGPLSPRSLPQTARTMFCARRSDNQLRWVRSWRRCGRGEFPVVLAARRTPANDPADSDAKLPGPRQTGDQGGPPGPAEAPATSPLGISTSPALFPDYSPKISDYVVRCTSARTVTVSVDAPRGTSVSIDGAPPQSGAFSVPVTLSDGEGFQISESDAHGAWTQFVRCLPAKFPPFTAAVGGPRQAEWYLVTPTLGAGAQNDFAAFFDNHGVPIWWKANGRAPLDMKLLSDGNVGWFSSVNGSPAPQFNELALDGTVIRSTTTVGSPTDAHDYIELPDGHRYLMTYRLRDHVDVSSFTGKSEDSDAAVQDAEVQELDADGNLVWAWNSSDHIALAETGRWWQSPPGKTSDNRNVYDILHINSIEPAGGQLIVSMRHADAVYAIDRGTRAIVWKLGGTPRPESLAIIGDDFAASDFGGQHDARLGADSMLTLHDNGTQRGRAPRALRFHLDTGARTATLVESLSDPEVPDSICCGSARRLPGGNWVMSWGGNGVVDELAPDGSRMFKLAFGPNTFSYRAQPLLPGVVSASALRAGMDAQYPR